MFLRLMYLIALLGVVGSDARTKDEEEPRMGGEGFGNVVMLMVIVGGLVVAGVVVFAMLALFGQFENTIVDPPV